MWVDEGAVGGHCDCPNAEDGRFCKHQVALAMVWRGLLGGEAPAPDETARAKVTAATTSAAKRARSALDRREALAEFLRSRDAQVMAQRLLQLADRDAAVERELHQWRKLSEVQQGAAGLTELKALATQILSPGRDFLDWRQTSGYAQRATDVLPLLAQTRARNPEDALALGLHALRRAWAAMEQADDSGGDIGGLARAIGDEWVEALRAAGARPAAFGDSYLQVLLDDPITSFDTAAAEAAMGDAARGRFSRSWPNAGAPRRTRYWPRVRRTPPRLPRKACCVAASPTTIVTTSDPPGSSRWSTSTFFAGKPKATSPVPWPCCARTCPMLVPIDASPLPGAPRAPA